MCDYCNFGYLKNIGNMQSGGSNPDLINHPPHYTQGGIDTFDFIKAKGLTYAEGNVIKYIVRARHKGNLLDDLKKAKWYLDQLIAEAENESQKT